MMSSNARTPDITFTRTQCSSCDEVSSDGHATVVGGAVGGATAVALVAVAIISVCIVVLLVKQKKTDHESATRFHNTIVEGKLQLCCTFTSMQIQILQITDVLRIMLGPDLNHQQASTVKAKSLK